MGPFATEEISLNNEVTKAAEKTLDSSDDRRSVGGLGFTN